jgi:hypothetical protein
MFSLAKAAKDLAVGIMFASSVFAQTTPAPELRIGDPAPAINGVKWVKGTPVKEFEKGRIYVVDFWASW